MATTKGSIVGREVYDKRAGVMGRVVKEVRVDRVVRAVRVIARNPVYG